MLQKLEISASLMGLLACMQTLPLPESLHVTTSLKQPLNVGDDKFLLFSQITKVESFHKRPPLQPFSVVACEKFDCINILSATA